MVSIAAIEDPFQRYIAFLKERDAIYQRKTRGDPWPWTEDDALQTYRFTEIYRERDRTSLHYQKIVRDRYGDDPIVLPATVLYRWFNRIETCDVLLGVPPECNKSIFEDYIENPREELLFDTINNIPPPHVTGAFIINGEPGYSKGIGVMKQFHQWCKKPWHQKWNEWKTYPPPLEVMFDWLRIDARGLGSFMAAQLVADLKYLPFMLKGVPDWWIWAAPGPGSMRGLNVVLGKPMDSPWRESEWLKGIQKLREMENEALAPLGPFHAQDSQNHCCEFSKYTKVITGQGRPRQVYRGTA